MSTSSNAVPAVVIGGGLNALGVVRSLAAGGVPITVVHHARNTPAMRSRHGKKRTYNSAEGDAGLISLLADIATHSAERPVLILTMEETVATVMRHHATLSSAFRLTYSGPESILPLLNKDGVRAAAEKAGARIPRTVRVQQTSEIDLIDGLVAPIVVKPSLRDDSYARGFSKAYRCDDIGSARKLLDEILPVLPDVVVQEWIEGTDSDLYFCLQYLPADTQALPTSFVGRKIRSWPPQVGGTASCGPAAEANEIIDATTMFFRQAGVYGLASMEYKRDTRTGEYVVVEPTVARTDFQEEVATLNGVNLPLTAYRNAAGLAPHPVATTSKAQVWRERVADTQSFERTPAGQTRAMEGATVHDALYRVSDPGPALADLADRIRRRLKRFF